MTSSEVCNQNDHRKQMLLPGGSKRHDDTTSQTQHLNQPNKTTNNANNPNRNTATKLESKSAQALGELRRRFLDYADQNPSRVNERDKLRLATDDWYLKRYLLARHRRVEETLGMLRNTMEWRVKIGLHLTEDFMFPMEFYKIGAIFPYENDRQGNLVLFLRCKYHRKIPELAKIEKHFLVHTFEKIDRITNGQGLVILFDFQGAGYTNCDPDFLQFLIQCAIDHAPVGLKYILIYRLPWVLNTFWVVAKQLLPAYLARRVRFCDENTITDYIEPKHLPDFMYGTCKRNYRWIPPGSQPLRKLTNVLGITEAKLGKIYQQFQGLLEEADEALGTATYEDPPDLVTNYINNPENTKRNHINVGTFGPFNHASTPTSSSSSSSSSTKLPVPSEQAPGGRANKSKQQQHLIRTRTAIKSNEAA